MKIKEVIQVNERAEMIDVGKKLVDVDGIKLNVSGDGASVEVNAMSNDGGKQLGYVVFNRDGNTLVPDDLAVDERYRGQGIAKIMYDYVKSLGFVIRRSHDQTSDGKSFWDKNRGEEGMVWEDGNSGYKEIEFVCANRNFCDATDPIKQRKLFQLLQKIPGVIPLYQDQSDYEEGQLSLSAIYKDKSARQQILKAAKSLGVVVDLEQPVDDDYIDRAIRGEHFGQIVTEKWSEKYKKSINCNNPKGFSQRAHCQGRKKVNENGGYVPANDKEAKDPRFKMALSVDVRPGEIKRQAAKMGLKTDARGNPPLLRK